MVHNGRRSRFTGQVMASAGLDCGSTVCQHDLYRFIGKCKLRFQMFQPARNLAKQSLERSSKPRIC